MYPLPWGLRPHLYVNMVGPKAPPSPPYLLLIYVTIIGICIPWGLRPHLYVNMVGPKAPPSPPYNN